MFNMLHIRLVRFGFFFYDFAIFLQELLCWSWTKHIWSETTNIHIKKLFSGSVWKVYASEHQLCTYNLNRKYSTGSACNISFKKIINENCTINVGKKKYSVYSSWVQALMLVGSLEAVCVFAVLWDSGHHPQFVIVSVSFFPPKMIICISKLCLRLLSPGFIETEEPFSGRRTDFLMRQGGDCSERRHTLCPWNQFFILTPVL